MRSSARVDIDFGEIVQIVPRTQRFGVSHINNRIFPMNFELTVWTTNLAEGGD
jgi:hypothetical protein